MAAKAVYRLCKTQVWKIAVSCCHFMVMIQDNLARQHSYIATQEWCVNRKLLYNMLSLSSSPLSSPTLQWGHNEDHNVPLPFPSFFKLAPTSWRSVPGALPQWHNDNSNLDGCTLALALSLPVKTCSVSLCLCMSGHKSYDMYMTRCVGLCRIMISENDLIHTYIHNVTKCVALWCCTFSLHTPCPQEMQSGNSSRMSLFLRYCSNTMKYIASHSLQTFLALW